MQYRPYGKTKRDVSMLGYIKGTSEVAVGKAIKGYDREKLFIVTKIPSNDIPKRVSTRSGLLNKQLVERRQLW